MEVTLSETNFESEVLQSDLPVLVDFWAPWCGPCQTIEPIIEELAKEYEGKLKIGKLNVDEAPQAASKFGVMSIPAVVFFKKGEEVKRQIGLSGKDEYKKVIDAILNG